MNHITEVLTGADTDKVRKWGHDRLTTYGIGKDLSRPHWANIGRELMRLGYLAVAEGEFATLELTPKGREILRSRAPVILTKPMDLPKARRVARREGDIACDEILFERLRTLRKQLADERGVPAYVVFGDTTLRELARAYPTRLSELGGITGIGEKKAPSTARPSPRRSKPICATNPRMAFD